MLTDHTRLLQASVARLIGAAEAEDVVQETFLRALVHPPDPSTPIAPWLQRVARNLAIDFLRRHGRIELTEVDAADTTELEAPSVPLGELLPRLGCLTRGEVVVLLLRDALELSVEEAALVVESSAGSVRVLHHRARRKAAAPIDDPAAGFAVLDRFLEWLLARQVAGLPVRSALTSGANPGFTGGVIAAHTALLDAMVEVAASSDLPRLEGRVRLARGTARSALGRRREALEDVRAAVALCGDSSTALYRLASIHYELGESDQAEAAAERALACGDEPRVAPQLYGLLARICHDRGDAAGARAHTRAIAATGDTVGVRVAAAAAAGNAALVEERFADAREQFTMCLVLMEPYGNLVNQASVTNNIACACLEAGELEEAARWLSRARELARQAGSASREAYVLGNVARVAQLEGRLDDAAEAWHRSIDAWRAVDSPPNEACARMNAAIVEHMRGRPAAALLALRDVVDRLEAPGVHAGRTPIEARAHLVAARMSLGECGAEALAPSRAEAVAAGSEALARAIDVLALLASPFADEALATLTDADLRSSPVRIAAYVVRGNPGQPR